MTRGPIMLLLLLAVAAPARPLPPKISCVLTNHPITTVHYNEDRTKGKEIEVDDWYVNCTIEVNGRKVWDAALVLAHPTELNEAVVAVDTFRKARAAQILKEMKAK